MAWQYSAKYWPLGATEDDEVEDASAHHLELAALEEEDFKTNFWVDEVAAEDELLSSNFDIVDEELELLVLLVELLIALLLELDVVSRRTPVAPGRNIVWAEANGMASATRLEVMVMRERAERVCIWAPVYIRLDAGLGLFMDNVS